MVFNTVQTSKGNVARSHIRTLSMNPAQYNFTKDACTRAPLDRQPLDTTVCLMCHIISHLKEKTTGQSGVKTLNTPCLTTKGNDAVVPEDTDSTEKLILSLSKNMSEILDSSCMSSEKDTLRQTVVDIVNHACKEWIGEDAETTNIKAILHRVEFTSVEDGISEVFHVYQLALFVAIPGRSAAVMVPLCKDDSKILVDQSCAFFMDHTNSVFTSHTYKNFNAGKSLTSSPCITWVNNIYKKLSANKDVSGRSAKLTNNGGDGEMKKKKKKKKKKREIEGVDDESVEVVEDAVVERAEPPKKKKKKKPAAESETTAEESVEVETNPETVEPKKKKKKTKSVNETVENELTSTTADEDAAAPKKDKKIKSEDEITPIAAESAEPKRVKKKKKKTEPVEENDENESPPSAATGEDTKPKKKKKKNKKSDENVKEIAPEPVDLEAVEEKKRRIKEIMASS